MGRLRSFYEVDREEKFSRPTNYRTRENQNELYCGICGESFFVDNFVFENVNRKIEETLENPFVCEGCLDEYEETAHRH